MRKKLLFTVLTFTMVLTLTACGEKKIVHCDNCGAEIEVKADSNVTDEWILYCEKCNKELGIEEKIIESFNQ